MPAAARFTDVTVHGSPMVPGTGSTNVLVGNLPQWRAMSPAAVVAFVKLMVDIIANVNKLSTALTTNNAPMAIKAGKDLADQVPQALSMIAAMDKIICPTLLIGIAGPPHGPGVMIGGSLTVQVNGLPAGRALVDPIQEVMCPYPNFCAVGLPTVQIGG